MVFLRILITDSQEVFIFSSYMHTLKLYYLVSTTADGLAFLGVIG